MTERKFDKLQKKYTQNLTSGKILNWKYDALCFLKLKIWRDSFFSIQILSRRKIPFQNHAF